MKERKKLITIFVFALVALGQSAIDLYLPSFTDIASHFAQPAIKVKLTLTLFLIGYSLSQLVYGPFSDKWGRRPVLLFGLMIFFFGCVGSVLATSINGLLFSRFIQGIGAGSANVLSRAILKDTFEGKELVRKFSYVGLSWVTVPILAPMIGGYLQKYFGWRMNFVVLASFSGFLGLLILFVLPETKDSASKHSLHPKTVIKNYLKLIIHKTSLGYILSAFALYGIFVSLYTSGPFLLLGRLGLSPVEFGWAMLMGSVGFLIGSFLNATFIHQWDRHKTIVLGLVGCLFSSGVLFVISWMGIFTTYSIIVPIFFLFLNIALIYPNCISGGLSAFPELSGSASALFGFSAFFGGSVTSALISMFSDKTPFAFSAVILSQCLLATVFLCGLALKHEKTLSEK